MIITNIELIINSKYKIFIDDSLIGALYSKEIQRLSLKIGSLVDENVYNEIYNILYTRAKERSLYLIQTTIKSKNQIKKKLRDNFYGESIIDRVIAFLEQYNFINDIELCNNYVRCYKDKYSKKVIEQKLLLKSIDLNIIKESLCLIDNEDDAIKNIILKKSKDINLEDYKERNKIIRHLLYKGYKYRDICNVLNGIF